MSAVARSALLRTRSGLVRVERIRACSWQIATRRAQMEILVAGLIAGVILLLLPRFIGRRQDRMLAQYEVLEKRFGFDRRVARSRWGRGIAERYSLQGENRGYPLRLYSHFQKRERGKTVWTSLVFEALFAEDLEVCIDFKGTQPNAKFEIASTLSSLESTDGVSIFGSSEFSSYLAGEALVGRLQSFSQKASCGALRLSKGFVEYRELGVMETEEQRLRFQEGILLLAHFCDAVSLFMAERNRIEKGSILEPQPQL